MKEALKLFWVFFKLGSITFGSGYVMVTVVEYEFADKRNWITKDEYKSYLTLATSFPGPIVINLAALIGHQKFGTKGLFAGFLGATLPSFIILLLVAMFFSYIVDTPVVEAIFKGLRPAVVGLIIVPVIRLARDVTKWEYLVFIGLAALIYLRIVSPIVIISSGVIGALIYNVYLNFKLKH